MKNHLLKISLFFCSLALSSCSSQDDASENTEVSVNYSVEIRSDILRVEGNVILNASIGIDDLLQTSTVLFPGVAKNFPLERSVPEEYAGFLRMQWQESGGPYTAEEPFVAYTLFITVVRNNDVSTAQEIEFNVTSAGGFPEHIFQF